MNVSAARISGWNTVRRIPPVVPLVLLLAVFYLAGTIEAAPWGGALSLMGLAVLVAAMVLLLRRSGLFLAIFLGFATVAPFLSRITPLPLSWFKGGFFLLAFPVWALTRAPHLSRWSWPSRVHVPFLCLLGSAALVLVQALVSLARGVPSLVVLDAARGYLIYPPLLFIAAEASSDRAALRRFLGFILALCSLTALGAIAQALLGLEWMNRLGVSLETWGVAFVQIDPLSGRSFQRVFSFLDDQLALASFSLAGMAIALYFLESRTRRIGKILASGAIALCMYTLILTYNMTVSIGTGIFFVLLVWKKRSPRLLLAMVLTFLAVVGVAWLRFGPIIKNRLITSFTIEVEISSSLAGRIDELRQGIAMFLTNPVIGSGLGSTASTVIYRRLGMVDTITGGIATDNFYLTTAVEGGLIVLVAVLLQHLIPLWGVIRLGRSPSRDDQILARIGFCWIVTLLLTYLSNAPGNTNPTNLLVWCLGGFAWGASRSQPQSSGIEGIRSSPSARSQAFSVSSSE